MATDIQAGQSALRVFYEASSPKPYATFDLMLDAIDKLSPAFTDGFGYAINQGGFSWFGGTAPISESKIQTAMTNLAAIAAGRMPQNLNDFFNYLSNEAVKVNFLDAIEYTAAASAVDVAKGAEQVGVAAIETGKNALGLVTYLPYVAFAALLAYVYLRVKKT